MTKVPLVRRNNKHVHCPGLTISEINEREGCKLRVL